jgi:hypothetical protein
MVAFRMDVVIPNHLESGFLPPTHRRVPTGATVPQQAERSYAVITILDETDNVLAVGILSCGMEGRKLVLEEVIAGKGSLLGYYFGRGRRKVVVETPVFRLRGQLRTQWTNGSRTWTVELLQATSIERGLARPELAPGEGGPFPAFSRRYLPGEHKRAG